MMLSYDSTMSNGQDKNSAGQLPPVASTSSAQKHGQEDQQQARQHIWLVTGPAGCGKTTVAEHLAEALKIPYVEGDQYHPAANIDKMSTGQPLNDADRWDWLTILRQESMRRINGGAEGVVVACSALKRKYRDVIRVAAYYDHRVLVHFIFLHAPADLLIERVTQRKNHYMGANMVKSQFESLEPPSDDETDVVTVDASQDADQVKGDALARATALLKEDQ